MYSNAGNDRRLSARVYIRHEGESAAEAMRRLAAYLRCGDTARLRLPYGSYKRLKSALRTARGLTESQIEAGEPLKLLMAEVSLIEQSAMEARVKSDPLPACDGQPRVMYIARALVDGGENALTEAILLEALRAFDAVQPLTLAELWSVPHALRAAVSEAYVNVAGEILNAVREYRLAETWVQHPTRLTGHINPAFVECALQRCADGGMEDAREALEQHLMRMGQRPETALRQAREIHAVQRVRLENLSSFRRLIGEMDWQRDFEALSQVEAELRRDPSNVYPQMDDESRQTVRKQVAVIAQRTGLPELTIARHAVAAARSYAGASEVERGSCCWWLYDDAGRAELLRRVGHADTRLPRVIPDPNGMRARAAFMGMTAALFMLSALWIRNIWLWLALLPVAWTSTTTLFNNLMGRVVKPRRLLKMDLERLPDAMRTLVVTPVLVPDVAHVAKMCDNLEALGVLERDTNISFLLLADFADADAETLREDDEIVKAIRERIGQMNARAGREKYYYLHRPRTLLKADMRWMGRDRKRGALVDLNRLLLEREDAANAFAVEHSACAALCGQFKYVVTLDADTRMLPGTVDRLVGAMAHPMNRGYAVMQPRMEALPSACVNRFAQCFTGAGGVDAYPVCASGLWMDLTGSGAYAGKGIYDVAAFQTALDGALPEGHILSHDFIEGAISGAASLGDVALYDGGPATRSGWIRRLHRWTRGDWQLLPMLWRKLPDGRSLAPLDRFRVIDNLIRSLRAPALFALLMAGAWAGDFRAFTVGAVAIFWEALLRLPYGDAMAWVCAMSEWAMLPVTAPCMVDAVLRVLWRVFVSGKHLLDWVPSADAEGGKRWIVVCGPLASVLMLMGMLTSRSIFMPLALAAVYGFGAVWLTWMEQTPCDAARPLDAAQTEAVRRLAGETWHFFETCVPLGKAALPPDNLQIDPRTAPVRRTSPTNIGLYLMSCVAAEKLGFVDETELLARITAALDAVERMERWHGHLFNWVDLDTLSALHPRYVSSVDSGNLAACALCCANAVEALDAALAERLRALAEGMDFAVLYDARRELFAIGMDVDANRLSQSHYDLLASEARILSFVAIMLGQVPLKHYQRLGRACVRMENGAALLSWSGTMFEYLLPELILRAPALSLLGQSARTAVQAQIRHAQRYHRPWGVSESGFHAFDRQMNYQYHAFGLQALSLGEATEGVVAPYAAALALMICPAEAIENLETMRALGWSGECGFYEAADYLRPLSDGQPALVKSHMAHHQGMALCAACDALTGHALSEAFMRDPRARSLKLLLEEKPCAVPRHIHRRNRTVSAKHAPQWDYVRAARPDDRLADVHLLRGREALALVTADGAVHYARKGIHATRFDGGLARRRDAAVTHVTDVLSGRSVLFGGAACEARYEVGAATFSTDFGAVKLKMTVCLSPENDTLFRALTLTNAGSMPARLCVTDIVPVALASSEAYKAHPAFQNLFVEAEKLDECGLAFTRRPRNRVEQCPTLVHAVCGAALTAFETRYDTLTGRMGDTLRPESIAASLSNRVGSALDPVSALKVEVLLAPEETRRFHFALALLDAGEAPEAWLKRMGAPERAARLSRAGGEILLDALGLSRAQYHRTDRIVALLFDARLAARAKSLHGAAEPCPRAALWALGLSGDRPIVALSARDEAHADAVRGVMRMHAWFEAMGVACDLVLIDDGASGYDRPVRNLLRRFIEQSALRGREQCAGGVWLLDGHALTDAQRDTLIRAASVYLVSAADMSNQYRRLWSAIERPHAKPCEALAPGLSTMAEKALELDNGYGGFDAEGGYVVRVTPNQTTPAPWCNLLANDSVGLLLSERAGGFLWHENSRSGRITPWLGDTLREGWSMMAYLCDADSGCALQLLPGACPQMTFRVIYNAERVEYAFDHEHISGRVSFYLDGDVIVSEVEVERVELGEGTWNVVMAIDWLMGTDARDAVGLRCWREGEVCFATGTASGVGWLAASQIGAGAGPMPDPASGVLTLLNVEDGAGNTLSVPLGDARHVAFGIGVADNVADAREQAWRFSERGAQAPVHVEPLLTIQTPEQALNHMANVFLPHQVVASRVCGRTGLYQPGGAYGFRDQLQDMLALLPLDPKRVREHILRCAARQFEAGDVLHWWHMPYTGVRTCISDDRLFLPFVTAEYVRQTGDTGILAERVHWLEDMPIPEGQEDVYAEMRPSTTDATLYEHCMRAFRACEVGPHGLARMGTGDWNDGMNRVGGESVWLSEFVAACADHYADIATDVGDQVWLRALADRHRAAVEEHGWDGAWYRRAYSEHGEILGGAACKVCQIDVLPQAWAVLAGLDAERCRQAMEAAREQLVDAATGIIRLLAPPFELYGLDVGYIQGYPEGVRENGAQYTHAACWYLLALIRMGDEARAHSALQMLMPYHHADTQAKAERYRVEPYVMAADVYARSDCKGRGGWTWYTGSAAWMHVCLLALLGYERRGDRVRICALLGDWNEAGVAVRQGNSQYCLLCRKGVERVTLDGKPVMGESIALVDDGQTHVAMFPPRSEI